MLKTSISSIFLLYSVTIDTPEKLELLRKGRYKNTLINLIVTSSAHSDVFSLPHEFANATELGGVTFYSYSPEKNGRDEMSIHTKSPRRAYVVFVSPGEHSLNGLPRHYRGYVIKFGPAAKPTADIIAIILQWKLASNIILNDQGHLGGILYQHVEELGTLPVLNALEFHINEENYDQIKVSKFIENISSLRSLHIKGSGSRLTEKEVQEFIAMNPLPVGWKYEAYGTYIYYNNYNY